jgi:hypothetical protein
MKTKFYLLNFCIILLLLTNSVMAQDRLDTYDGREFNAPPLDINKKGAPYINDNSGKDNSVLESLTPSEGFEGVTFPPTGWTWGVISGAATQRWLRTSSLTVGSGAYGLSFACANFNAFNAAVGTVQFLQTPSFPTTVGGEILRFDWHYLPYSSGGGPRDSLAIQTSTDGGSTWTDLLIMWGDTAAVNYFDNQHLITGTRTTSSAITDVTWGTKMLSLPAGTNSIRFVGYSQFGNNIYLDNVETLVPGAAYTAGTYTINPSNPPSATNWQTFRAAADSLNRRGITGNLTINVSPGIYGVGNRFYLDDISGTSSSNRITFQKSGAGQVLLADTGTASANDYAILIAGADWVTFDGIDIRDVSTVANGQLHRGYYLSSYRGLDGPNNIVIKNSHIVLGGALNPPGASIGVVGTGMNGGATFPTIPSSTCDSVKIQNVRVNKSDRGFGFFGAFMTGTIATAWHTDIEISNCLLGDSISIGSRTAPNPIGIIPQGCKELSVFNNRIDSLGNYLTTSTAAVTGIACQISSGRVFNNTLRNLFSAHPTVITPVVTGIQSGPNSGEQAFIYNNLIYNLSKGYTGAASGTITVQGINLTNFVTGALASTLSNAYNNTIILETSVPVSYTSAGISLFAAGLVTNVGNNSIINKISTTVAPARSYGIADPNAANTFLKSNYNNIFVNGTNGFTGGNGTGFVNTAVTIADWKTISAGDTNSVSGDVAYITLFPLNIDATNSGNWVLNGKGHPLAIVTTDINGAPRNTSVSQGTSDIGANEFNMSVAPPFATESAAPSSGGTSIYMQFGDTVCIVNWGTGGTLPTGLNIMNRTGDIPPNAGTSHHLASYMDVAQVGGPLAGTTYDMTMKFGYNQLFNTSSVADLRFAKQNGTFWTAYLEAGTGNGQTEVNDAGRRLTVRGLNSLSNFTATDITDPLSTVSLSPTLLVPANNSVTVPPDQPQVFVWSESNEIVPRPGNTERIETDNTITSYHFQLYADTNSAPLFQDSTLTDTTVTHNPNLVALTPHWWRVRAKNENGWGPFASYFKFTTDQASGLTTGNTIPTVYDLFQNYPNPFNPATSIKFDIPLAGFVSLKVYDVTGREVANLVNSVLEPASYSVNWNASQFASGVYYTRIQSGDFVKVQKMMLIK